jgi:hypothetical protein
MAEEMKHHEFGPSSLRRRELCPGSVFEERGLPDVSNPDSDRGTRLHDMIAAVCAYNDKDIKNMGAATDEERELVSAMYEFFKDRTAIYEPLFFETESLLVYKKDGEVLFFGTCDVLAQDNAEKHGLIIDWKTGWGEVAPAEDNVQGAAYAIAAMQMYGLEAVTVCFFNPVARWQSEYTFRRSDALFRSIEEIIGRSMDGKGVLSPGDEQCRYCKAALHGTCPALRALTLDVHEVAEKQPLDALPSMPDEQLAELVEKGKVVGKLLKAAEDELKSRCEERGEVAGWCIKETSGGREIKDLNALWGRVRDYFESTSAFLECCSVSVPQVERQVIAEEGLKGKAGKEFFADLVNDLLTEKTPRRVLAKAKGE